MKETAQTVTAQTLTAYAASLRKRVSELTDEEKRCAARWAADLEADQPYRWSPVPRELVDQVLRASAVNTSNVANVRERAAEGIRARAAGGLCPTCGRTTERRRPAYAWPQCYDCLPPPEEPPRAAAGGED